MKRLLRVLGWAWACFSLLLGGLLTLRIQSPAASGLMLPKALAGSLSPLGAALGAAGALLGLLTRSPLAVLAGAAGALVSARYVRQVTAPHAGFERAFGPAWQARISPERAARLPQHRWTGGLLPHAPQPRWERDVPFWTVPGTDRQLLCDLWQPPRDVPPSGLVFVYCHGGGWQYLDKDVATRPFFRHLAAQGHVVMDVAYRLLPETDMRGMIADVKRAIAWIKANAARYGVDPARVVVAGGSAGAHLALMAAYTPGHPGLTPDDLQGVDTSVRAVVSYYGPANIPNNPDHVLSVFGGNAGDVDGVGDGGPGGDSTVRRAIRRGMRRASAAIWRAMLSYRSRRSGAPVDLLSGLPDDLPNAADFVSPLTYVGPGCPPTLLFQGECDSLVPASAARRLYRKLQAAGVPVVYVEFPQTEHAFDLILPQVSPLTQVALYDLDRFLALM